MTDIRKAAMQAALEALNSATQYGAGGFEDAKDLLRVALAQPEPEPLAWVDPMACEFLTCKASPLGYVQTNLRKTPEDGNVPLYLHPSQPEQQSLSQKMRAAGFTPRDTRLTCDECGAKYTPQMAPLHECAQPEQQAPRCEYCAGQGETYHERPCSYCAGSGAAHPPAQPQADTIAVPRDLMDSIQEILRCTDSSVEWPIIDAVDALLAGK